MRQRLLVGIFTGALAAVVAVGTGAGATVDAAKKPLTKAQFIKKADKICAQGVEDLRPLIQEHFGDLGRNEVPSDAAVQAYADDLLPILQKGHDDIEKLREPKADKAEIEALLDLQQEAIDAIEDDPSLVLNGNILDDASEAAQDYGFKVCGYGAAAA